MGVVAVLRSHELPEGGKVYKEVGNRSLLLLRRHGVTYCIDAHCHHMGRSLAEGEVTDVEDAPAIVCPWHGRKIGLATGCLLGGNDCTQQRQRTHEVREVGGTIWVNIHSEPEQLLESDRYNTAKAPKSPMPFVGFGLASRPDFSQPGVPSPQPQQPAALPSSPAMVQEQIQFPQRRFGLTRNAAARQAVMQKMRQPPMKAATPPMGTQKSLFDTQLFGAGVAPMQH